MWISITRSNALYLFSIVIIDLLSNACAIHMIHNMIHIILHHYQKYIHPTIIHTWMRMKMHIKKVMLYNETSGGGGGGGGTSNFKVLS